MTSIKKKETHWLRRAVSVPFTKATRQKVLMGIWRVSSSTRQQSLAVRSILVFSPSGYKFVGALYRLWAVDKPTHLLLQLSCPYRQ
eukprot:159782-Pelagomonas_calceolata.AAC.1